MAKCDDRAAGWVQLSARLQRVAATRTSRTDLVLRISPELEPDSAGWSGLYRHDLAEIRIPASAVMGKHADPRRVDLTTQRGRLADPTMSGALILATAHAAHTTWTAPSSLDTISIAVDLIERLRVTRVQLREHLAERRWLRAAASLLATSSRPASPTWTAIGTLGLEVVGVLTAAETAPVRDQLAPTFAVGEVSALEQILRDGAALPDGTADELRTYAEQLAALLDQTPPAPGEDQDGDKQTVADLRRALNQQPTRNDRASPGAPPAGPREADLQLAERDLARAAAADTFGRRVDAEADAVREPGPELRHAARALAGALRRARYRAADTTLEPTSSPPGRLRLAEAMRREAQRAAGGEVTARPWLQIRRRAAAQPPLRVGLSWDISRSRSALHTRTAELAWALSWATRYVGGELAAVAWNSRTRTVQWPGRVPSEVVEPACGGGSSACPQSLRALDGALDLHEPLGARVVIVVTDERVPNRRAISAEVARLIRHGVHVLWVTPLSDPKVPAGALNVPLPDPDTLVETLGDAVCQLLARAQS